MKKTAFLILIFISSCIYAQEKEGKPLQDINKKHEVKINALTLLAAKWLDVSYEKLIDEESSLGVSATLNTDTAETDLNFALTPYYRRYFSGKFARGFFVEGFGALFSRRDSDFLFNSKNESFETGFALGVSVGGKFVSKKGFTTELLLGVGRNLIKSDYDEPFGRIAISVGYRF
ncbi:DUF3575 domain-containing protein [Polaribacter aquimarinus]|mgnify:CR=1 FL=1|uniref:DUF3575 domain-containing protein n=1 Tax=Polaribacter aquimarinus TaxID=2100726 RepID=A0A2U2JD32_9FLAO|nr:DUF3575 domain-containing protein [Polaribacter aquimarinus]PWG06248.1 DUF3575 domain-containing protein [Polaribacter aquimarinus]